MFTLESGSGFWNPVLWALIIGLLFLLWYGIRGFGRKSYKKDTSQTAVFLSGNPEPPIKDLHVKASNLYWGFTTTLKSVYNGLRSIHTGDTSDYVLWLIIILAVFFLLIGVM
jgi:hypothetical protein